MRTRLLGSARLPAGAASASGIAGPFTPSSQAARTCGAKFCARAAIAPPALKPATATPLEQSAFGRAQTFASALPFEPGLNIHLALPSIPETALTTQLS